MNTEVQTSRVPGHDSGSKRVWFTGYVNASATQLSGATGCPYIGCSVFTDLAPNAAAPLPFGPVSGWQSSGSSTQCLGICVTQAATANLGLWAGVVTGGEPQCFQTDGSGNAQAGWLYVSAAAEAALCSTHANMTAGATFLSGTNGQWYLGTTNSMTAIPSTTTPTISGLAFTVGLALETKDTSTTTGNAYCKLFGGSIGTKL